MFSNLLITLSQTILFNPVALKLMFFKWDTSLFLSKSIPLMVSLLFTGLGVISGLVSAAKGALAEFIGGVLTFSVISLGSLKTYSLGWSFNSTFSVFEPFSYFLYKWHMI